MTDKQIIIDGVDVAKCRCFTSKWDFNNCGHICKGTECKYKRLWYKKQLKAKEQECEELKQNLVEIKEIINDFAKQDILTFPDLKPKENYKLIQKQCSEPIIQILQKINEVI